jgi:hypothetical protein
MVFDLDPDTENTLTEFPQLITEAGGGNLDTTFTTTQTVFTQDQELITKKYVDDNEGSCSFHETGRV